MKINVHTTTHHHCKPDFEQTLKLGFWTSNNNNINNRNNNNNKYYNNKNISAITDLILTKL